MFSNVSVTRVAVGQDSPSTDEPLDLSLPKAQAQPAVVLSTGTMATAPASAAGSPVSDKPAPGLGPMDRAVAASDAGKGPHASAITAHFFEQLATPQCWCVPEDEVRLLTAMMQALIELPGYRSDHALMLVRSSASEPADTVVTTFGDAPTSRVLGLSQHGPCHHYFAGVARRQPVANAQLLAVEAVPAGPPDGAMLALVQALGPGLKPLLEAAASAGGTMAGTDAERLRRCLAEHMGRTPERWRLDRIRLFDLRVLPARSGDRSPLLPRPMAGVRATFLQGVRAAMPYLQHCYGSRHAIGVALGTPATTMHRHFDKDMSFKRGANNKVERERRKAALAELARQARLEKRALKTTITMLARRVTEGPLVTPSVPAAAHGSPQPQPQPHLQASQRPPSERPGPAPGAAEAIPAGASTFSDKASPAPRARTRPA